MPISPEELSAHSAGLIHQSADVVRGAEAVLEQGRALREQSRRLMADRKATFSDGLKAVRDELRLDETPHPALDMVKCSQRTRNAAVALRTELNKRRSDLRENLGSILRQWGLSKASE